jgi:hypothetical protein
MTLELDLRKSKNKLKPIIAEQNRKQNTEWKKWKQIRDVQNYLQTSVFKEKSNARHADWPENQNEKVFYLESVWEMGCYEK